MAINAQEIAHSAFIVDARIVTSATICARRLTSAFFRVIIARWRNETIKNSAGGPISEGERHRIPGDRTFASPDVREN
jgi:hypothetical protein